MQRGALENFASSRREVQECRSGSGDRSPAQNVNTESSRRPTARAVPLLGKESFRQDCLAQTRSDQQRPTLRTGLRRSASEGQASERENLLFGGSRVNALDASRWLSFRNGAAWCPQIFGYFVHYSQVLSRDADYS